VPPPLSVSYGHFLREGAVPPPFAHKKTGISCGRGQCPLPQEMSFSYGHFLREGAVVIGALCKSWNAQLPLIARGFCLPLAKGPHDSHECMGGRTPDPLIKSQMLWPTELYILYRDAMLSLSFDP
jgi:hypothetical protein